MDTKRTEKLASAIYLITSFFSDLEPMKWRLRELSGKLILHRDNRFVVEEIKGLLNVAKNSGLLSEANHSIIYKEFLNLSPETPTLSQVLKIDESSRPTQLNQHRELGQSPTESFYLSSSVSSHPKKDNFGISAKNSVKDISHKKDNREEIIISLVKKRGEVMIKDVVPAIHGVSEKTIQRVLLSLVSKGILHKVGEKRWSRYRLAISA